MAVKKAEPDINKYKLVFIPQKDFDLIFSSLAIGERFSHEILVEKGIENLSLRDSIAIYIPDTYRKTLMDKAEKGTAL